MLGLPYPPRFLLDVHLGRLARYLRLLGFDAAWDDGLGDAELAELSHRERRILLSRDRELLRRGEVAAGYFVESTVPREQVVEVARRLGLAAVASPFRRCLVCNAILEPVAKEEVAPRLPPAVRDEHQRFRRCSDCGRLYWRGSHYRRMRRFVEAVLQEADAEGPAENP